MMQNFVALSATEVKLMTGTSNSQDIMNVKTS